MGTSLAPARLPEGRRTRPLVAFFDHADAFEDFYPHYGVTQEEFGRRWHGSGNHAWVRWIQRELGDVVWYEFCVKPQLSEAHHEWAGCRVRFLATSWLHGLLWRTFYLSRHGWRLRPLAGVFAVLASYTASLSPSFLRRIVRDRPDVLFSQDYSNGRFDLLVLLGRLWNIRVVAYHAGSSPSHYASRLLKRWTIRAADRILASNGREADMLVRDFGVRRERVDVLLTPIDTDAYRPFGRDVACRLADLDPERRYVLFVGRLDDRIKRVSMLIDSFARVADRLANIELLVAGDGEDREALVRRSREVGPAAIRFLGWRRGAAELAPLYSAADCLVLISRSEGFPSVVGEALACGTPVIGTDVGGVSELVEDGRNGWLLPAGSDEAVSEALEGALYAALTMGSRSASMRRWAREAAMTRVSHQAVLDKLRVSFGVAS